MKEKSPLDSLRDFGRAVWNYSGTLASLSLLVGVIAVMLVHMGGDGGRAEDLRYYRGFVDEPDQRLPSGMGQLQRCGEASLGGHVRFEYSGGKLRRVVCADGKGVPVAIDDVCGVAMQKMVYDGEGRLVRKENVDVEGRLCDDCSGVAARDFEYDAAGHLVGMCFLDKEGRLVAPAMPGYAEMRSTYEKGRLASTVFLGANGKPCVDRMGSDEVRYGYDGKGRLEFVRYYAGGRPADNVYGYAEKKQAYNDRGFVASVSYVNAEGGAAVSRHLDEGCMKLCRVYDDAGRCVSERFCNEAGGIAVSPVKHYAECRREYDAAGNLLRESFLDAKGVPCVYPRAGYASRVCRYDAGGRLVSEEFLDAAGRPGKLHADVPPRACLEKRYVYDGGGACKHVLNMNADGSKSMEVIGR